MSDPTPRTFRIEIDGRALGVERVPVPDEGNAGDGDLIRIITADGSTVDVPVSLSGALLQGLKSVTDAWERRFGGRRGTGLPRNAGRPWDESDAAELKRRFLEGEAVNDLATHFQRTRGAIESRLVMLGVVEDPFERLRPRSAAS